MDLVDTGKAGANSAERDLDFQDSGRADMAADLAQVEGIEMHSFLACLVQHHVLLRWPSRVLCL